MELDHEDRQNPDNKPSCLPAFLPSSETQDRHDRRTVIVQDRIRAGPTLLRDKLSSRGVDNIVSLIASTEYGMSAQWH